MVIILLVLSGGSALTGEDTVAVAATTTNTTKSAARISFDIMLECFITFSLLHRRLVKNKPPCDKPNSESREIFAYLSTQKGREIQLQKANRRQNPGLRSGGGSVRQLEKNVVV